MIAALSTATPAPAPAPSSTNPAPAPTKSWTSPPAMTIKPGVDYRATIATTDGKLAVQLLPGLAPTAVNNFVFLAKQGFYHHIPIHRMMPNFMFQSGDPTGTGTGGPGYTIPDDPMPAGMKYSRGVLAMANSGPNSSGSQFFVMLGDTDLPPSYTVLGFVTEGGDVLDKINARAVGDNGQGEQSKPTTPIFVEDVSVSESPVT